MIYASVVLLMDFYYNRRVASDLEFNLNEVSECLSI